MYTWYRRCKILINDEKAIISTIATQILCERTCLNPDKVLVDLPDTFTTPNSWTTTTSRQTVFTGEATRRAAIKLRDTLEKII